MPALSGAKAPITDNNADPGLKPRVIESP